MDHVRAMRKLDIVSTSSLPVCFIKAILIIVYGKNVFQVKKEFKLKFAHNFRSIIFSEFFTVMRWRWPMENNIHTKIHERNDAGVKPQKSFTVFNAPTSHGSSSLRINTMCACSDYSHEIRNGKKGTKNARKRKSAIENEHFLIF